MNDATGDLARIEGLLAGFWDRLDSCCPSEAVPMVFWQRDGLVTVHARLDALKLRDAALDALWTDLMQDRALCQGWLKVLGWAEDDELAEGLESRVSLMTTRGMAWEERRIAHKTRVIETETWRRRYELAADALRSAEDALRVRMERVKSERFALQSQTRLINLALEIGEL